MPILSDKVPLNYLFNHLLYLQDKLLFFALSINMDKIIHSTRTYAEVKRVYYAYYSALNADYNAYSN